MYKQRLHAFIILGILAISVCIARLAHLQTKQHKEAKDQIVEKRVMAPQQLATVRGSILDRNGQILAIDRPTFFIDVNYQLTRLLDDRFYEANIQKLVDEGTDRDAAMEQIHTEYDDDFKTLLKVMDNCEKITGINQDELADRIRKINNAVWNLRLHIAFWEKFPNASQADRKQKEEKVSLVEILETDLAENRKSYSLIELANEQQRLEAQIAFSSISGAGISPQAKRIYPYDSQAVHLIGWVGKVNRDSESELFSEDDYSRYLPGEISGKTGIERVCETVLRGRRGEVTYDKDRKLLDRKETLFGRDVKLSIDIELQSKLQAYISAVRNDPNSVKGIATVILDVKTCDILAMVTTPTYKREDARRNYGKLLKDRMNPLINRALANDYNPGSTVKPLILIAGLQEKKIAPDQVISCPMENQQEKYKYPNCILFRMDSCHDWAWQYEGGNTARNAIRGSCNVYFSRLANRLDTRVMQSWLYKFGFGRKILLSPVFEDDMSDLERNPEIGRNLPQTTGLISNYAPDKSVESFDDIPKLPDKSQSRLFGIGQGNLRASPLQVANSMAVIARGGIYKSPRLYIGEGIIQPESAEDLGLSRTAIVTVRNGMHDVVYKSGGTAHKTYQASTLASGSRDIRLYGKTGSTQAPENAWYSGFVEDSKGRSIALAIIVEGGKSGSRDAAPLAMDIIQICNEMGYIGSKP